MKAWMASAAQGSVVRRACLYAVIVGPILIIINQGDQLLAGKITACIVVKMVLTMLVPYLVSTFSSVGAMRG